MSAWSLPRVVRSGALEQLTEWILEAVTNPALFFSSAATAAYLDYLLMRHTPTASSPFLEKFPVATLLLFYDFHLRKI